MRVLVDGDEIAFKSSAHSAVWCKGMSLFRTKKLALESQTEGDVYRQTFSPAKDTVETQMISMVKSIRERVLEKFGTYPSVSIIISGPELNYRKQRYPDYKSNRENVDLPYYLAHAKQYLLAKYRGSISVEEEADDVMGVLQGKETIIASTDKDMLTIPGHNYNIMRGEFTKVTPYDADFNFYNQILTGDIADGVKGIKGIGPVKAKKILLGSKSKVEMLRRVIQAYSEAGLNQDDVDKAGFLLYIRRNPEEMWSIQGVLSGQI